MRPGQLPPPSEVCQDTVDFISVQEIEDIHQGHC